MGLISNGNSKLQKPLDTLQQKRRTFRDRVQPCRTCTVEWGALEEELQGTWGRSVSAGDEPLGGSFLVAGGAVDLPRQV